MYTSDRVKGVDLGRIALMYLAGSVFLAVFGFIYELFSHEVYSASMIYAFLIPLVGGCGAFLALDLFAPEDWVFAKMPRNLYHCGIMTLSVGSVFRGVLEIYGTTNQLSAVYFIVGGAMLVGGTVGVLRINRAR